MVLILCFFAGAFVFSTSLRRVMEYQLDAPRMNTGLAAEHERLRTSLAGLERVDAQLDAWEEQRPSREGTASQVEETAAEEARKRIDAEFSSTRAEAERAAQAVWTELPRKERLRSFARVTDAVFVVIGAVLMVVSPILGISMVL